MRNTSISCALGGAVCLLLAGFLAGCSDENTSSKPVVTRARRHRLQPSNRRLRSILRLEAAGKPMAKPSDETKLVAADTSAEQPEAAPARPLQGNEETTFSGAISGTGGLPAKTAAKGDDETVKVGACDGGNAVEVPKELTGQPLADSLMDQWKRNHPEAKWVAEEKERHTLKPPADNADLLKRRASQGRHLRQLHRARPSDLGTGDGEVRRGGFPDLPQCRRVGQHGRRFLRHVPSPRGQHAPGDLSQVPGPVGPRRSACAT